MENIVQKSLSEQVQDLTHLDLVNHIAQERGWEPGSSSYRSFKAHVSAWCRFKEVSLESPAVRTLGAYEGPLNRLTDQLSMGSEASPDKAKNIRWAVVELARVYESFRLSYTLPSDYREALHQAIAAKGWEPKDLIAAVKNLHPRDSWRGDPIRHHLNGMMLPNAGKAGSKELVGYMEKALDLPEGTLARRAFKAPRIIKVGNPREIPYRAHHSKLTKKPYALKKLPPSFEKFWKALAYWRGQASHTVRSDGKVDTYIVPAGSRWTSANSADKYEANVRRYLGWLALPAPTKPLYELTEEELWLTGAGLSVAELTLAHLFNLDLVWQFIEFLRVRQHNKAYTQDHLHFLVFLNSLVNHPYSFVKANNDLAPIFGQNLKGAEWVAYVETSMHQPLLALSRQLRKSLSNTGRQRSADEPLADIFAEKSPLLYIREMVFQMKENLAPVTHRQAHASQLRDIALFLMAMEVPLRCQNFAELKLGTDLTKDSATGCWKIFVPKARLKNRHSAHAKDIHRTYSAETSEAIDQYLASGRPLLPGHASPFFLLASASGPHRVADDTRHPDQVREGTIYWFVRTRTEQYFGQGVGSNLFRHLLATAILKDAPGNVEVAAAVLNNSPDTVRSNYKHITQQDGLRVADGWLIEQKKLHADTFDRGSV